MSMTHLDGGLNNIKPPKKYSIKLIFKYYIFLTEIDSGSKKWVKID